MAVPLLPNDARQSLDRDGFVHIEKILGTALAHQLSAAFLDHIGPNPETNAYGVLRNNIWTHIELFEHHLKNGVLPEIAGRLLGAGEVICFQDNVICKMPQGPDPVEWHQDFSYWPLNRPDGITLWVALTDSDKTNGCLKFAAGSHHLGERCPTNFVPNSNQPLKPDLLPLDTEEAQRAAVAIPVRAGGVIAHHPLAWHSSEGNASNAHRIAWSITFLKPSVTWDPDHAPHPFNLAFSPKCGDPVQGPEFPRFSIRLW